MSPRDRLVLTIAITILIVLTSWGSSTTKEPQSTPKQPSAVTTSDMPSPEVQSPEHIPNKEVVTPAVPADALRRVIRVVDGDTFIIEGGQSVRMIGMNTPELFPRDGSAKDCYAEEATAHTIDLIFQKEVRLVKDVSDTDKYGRLLRYVYVGDTFVNLDLVTGGFARVRAYKPDTKHHSELLKAMNIAAKEKRGLWGACN
jgi:micrococcal nuclease